MELKFQSNLDFQLDAINSVVQLFESQKFVDDNYWNVGENGIISNRLDLDDSQILENLNYIQRENKISEAKNLKNKNFTIEMETGTGKTYVYLRSIFELNKNYGFKKFMIVVPSIAIREGVIKNLQITEKHFKSIYDNISYRYYEYDSKKINHIRQFSRGSTIEIMIITIDSFKKDTAIMNQERDVLQGQKPIELVSKTRPILILDEPQNMETEKAKESLEKLNSLFTLRYSATHREYYNLVYRLTPIDAAEKNLVKKIEVSSVTEDGNYNDAFIHCAEIKITNNKIKAKLDVNKKTNTAIKLSSITVRNNDDLFKKTNNPEYSGFVVSEINARYNFIKFSNGVKLKQGQEQGKDKDKIIESQIRHTVAEHFEKYERLKKDGIKPLSLFFIDKVDNYLHKDGFIRKTFEESFNQIKKEYPDFKNVDVKNVHSGYFSKKKTDKSIEMDKSAFDLIMKDKEKLLSFDEPVQFIFSHSALREGWDSPNVFNICTLNQTVSSIKKRQEIGRGMRLPVNQQGDRITNKEHILTVVANESYKEYVSKLQQEYVDEYGDVILSRLPADGRKKSILKIKKHFNLIPEFEKLWDKVSEKTEYAVKIDTDKLIEECINEINANIATDSIKIKIETVELKLEKEGEGIKTIFKGSSQNTLDKVYRIPNIVEHISNETRLTRTTIVQILTGIDNLNLIFKNPQEFIASCTRMIKAKMADFLINGIEYLKNNDLYRMELFENLETYSNLIVEVKKTIYDGVVYDSEIEKSFAKDLDNMSGVKLFVKLPKWFTVSTPIGDYNPDWAIVKDNVDALGKTCDTLYFVTETKGTQNIDELRPKEKQKILCGRKHFKTIGVRYEIAKDIDHIKNMT